MPTYDGGHYFLTALLPVRTDLIPDGHAFVSPLQALRKQLAILPASGGQSPFARNSRNHLVRFTIIDDVAYNGREPAHVLLMRLMRINPAIAQPQDHLSCPFLYFAAEFDAASGAGSERDSYLTALWDTMPNELRNIFTYCHGFDASVRDAASFAAYIARGELETTFSFNDYYVGETEKNLPVWPVDPYGYLIPAIVGGVFITLGFFTAWFLSGRAGFVLILAGAGTLGFVLWRAYQSIMAAGAKPFPAAPDSNLPTILKALHLQKAFTQFVIDTQLLAVQENSADELHAAFGTFLARNRPDSLDYPTQPPGVVGI